MIRVRTSVQERFSKAKKNCFSWALTPRQSLPGDERNEDDEGYCADILQCGDARATGGKIVHT